jgi:hypothetical protein
MHMAEALVGGRTALLAENSDVEWGKQSRVLAQFKASLDDRICVLITHD